jgi:tetratricopeptide (TPR) repeat protein
MKTAFGFPLVAALLFTLMGASSGISQDEVEVDRSADIDSLWDYWDPSGTRPKFEAALSAAQKNGDPSLCLELQTQIARTFGLESEFDRAHALLDTVESALTDTPAIVHVRYLLERGRTFRSSGEVGKSEPLFIEAFDRARAIGADFYAVDAAHMIALVVSERADKQKWHLLGVDIAEKSDDDRARGWLGSLYNNIGWDFLDHAEYEQALDMFDKTLAFRIEQGKVRETAIAKWCIARTLRSLERHDEALKIQIDLQAEYDSTGQADGYVYEELGELYLLTGKPEQSQKYFALAYAELAKDDWFVKNEAARLQRMKKLGSVED